MLATSREPLPSTVSTWSRCARSTRPPVRSSSSSERAAAAGADLARCRAARPSSAVRTTRRAAAGDRAGGCPHATLAWRRDRRARRGVALGHGAVAGRRPPRHPARHDRVVVPPVRPRRAAAVPPGWPSSPTASSSTRPTHLAAALGLAARAPRTTSSHCAAEHGGRRADGARGPVPAARDDAGLRPRALSSTASGRGSARRWPTGWRRCAGLPPDQPVHRRGRAHVRAPRARGRQLAGGGAVRRRERLGRAGRHDCAARRPTSSSSVARSRRRGPPLLDVCGRPAASAAPCCRALIVSASGATDAAELRAWAREVQRIDAHHPTGLGGLMRWVTLAWQGDFAARSTSASTRRATSGSAAGVRDLFVGIAVLDHFSLTGPPRTARAGRPGAGGRRPDRRWRCAGLCRLGRPGRCSTRPERRSSSSSSRSTTCDRSPRSPAWRCPAARPGS